MWPELATGIAGALLGAVATFIVAQRKLQSENIITERMKWRDKVRSIADELAIVPDDVSNDRLRRQLALNLNPLDLEDRKILAVARRFPRSKSDQDELTDRIALLLKHDWERAKIESSWFPVRTCSRHSLEDMN